MWAINGAASIAGSVLAAVIGITLGSQFVIAAALLCYAVAVIAGSVAEVKARDALRVAPNAAQRTTSLV
jgi:nucleoside permease NupC